jgi:hypothetical protein
MSAWHNCPKSQQFLPGTVLRVHRTLEWAQGHLVVDRQRLYLKLLHGIKEKEETLHLTVEIIPPQMLAKHHSFPPHTVSKTHQTLEVAAPQP